MSVVQADLPAEFAATTAATVTLWIGVATDEVESAKWTACGLDAEQGIVLLASHYLKAAGEGTSESTSAAIVKSEKVGDVSISYATETSSSSGATGKHPSTTYGRAYDQLLARVDKCRSTKPAAYFGSSNGCRTSTRRTTTNGCGC